MQKNAPYPQAAVCARCGVPFQVPRRSPHKRFCTEDCTLRYWEEARAVGDAALRMLGAYKQQEPAA